MQYNYFILYLFSCVSVYLKKNTAITLPNMKKAVEAALLSKFMLIDMEEVRMWYKNWLLEGNWKGILSLLSIVQQNSLALLRATSIQQNSLKERQKGVKSCEDKQY